MAESTLALTLVDLNSEVGHFLGYGRGAVSPYADTLWTSQQQADIDSCVRSGLRQFYFPPPIPQQTSAYDWSFLKPMANLSLASGANTVLLPDDYGGLEGRVIVSAPLNQAWWPVDVVGVGRVYAQQALLPTTTGRPVLACEEPLKGTQATQGQRFQLRVWPKADTNYTLQLEYYVLPEILTTALPFTYGGMIHTETILESCLAVAEERLDDQQTVHKQKFAERLVASISADRRMKPQKLGYNGDNSDFHFYEWQRGDLHGWTPVTVYGVAR